jgi:hypothetical protein
LAGCDLLFISGRDLEAAAVRCPLHHGGQKSAKPKQKGLADILAAIRERRAQKRCQLKNLSARSHQ